MNISQLEHIQDQDFMNLVAIPPQTLQNRVARQFQVLQENPLYSSISKKSLLVSGQSVRIPSAFHCSLRLIVSCSISRLICVGVVSESRLICVGVVSESRLICVGAVSESRLNSVVVRNRSSLLHLKMSH